jgi:tetratricopeptide (TPR) repeat protein
LLGSPEINLERAERSLRLALELDPSLSLAYSWLSSTLVEQGRFEESYDVLEQGLLIDPLHPVMSYNMALWLRNIGEHDRAEQLLLRLTNMPEPSRMAYSGLYQQYIEVGEYDKALHWSKKYALADAHSQGAVSSAIIAACYERLGLTEDSDFWLADALARTPQPERRFFFRANQFRIRGDRAGLQMEIDKLNTALGSDMDQLLLDDAGLYASANILAENFDIGIDVFENVYDLDSQSLSNDVSFNGVLEFLHILAYAYQQVGRDDEAHALLARLHEHLNVLVVDQKLNSGSVHHLRAQNFGQRGDFAAAADALEDAIQSGWLRYIWVTGNPVWAETIAYPRIARMLDDVKVELDRQRAVVQQADAEHDFRSELEAMRNASGG